MNTQPIEEQAKRLASEIHSCFASAYAIEEKVNPEWLQNKINEALTSAHAQGVESERERWVQRLPEETFSITIEGRFDKKVVANRKFISMKSIQATSGRTLMLESEACAYEILQSLVSHTKTNEI